MSEARPWGYAPGEQAGVRLEPRRAPLAGLVIKGMLLTLVTLGLYRFWFKSNLRRYYWANTRLLDDGFEYTGTGRELFIGFLIALAVIVPLNIASIIITLAMGESAGQFFGALTFLVIVPALVQIAVYRARRYRLSRTRYRGIRFAQAGTGTAYLLHSIKWLILTAVTLGICLPMMRTALYRYRTENTFFGTVQAQFEGTAKPLMKRWLVVWGAMVGAILFFVIAIISNAAGFRNGVIFELLVAFAALCSVPVLWLAYRAAEFRHFTSHTRFGAMALASDVRTKPIIWLMVKFGLLLVLAFGVLIGLVIAGIVFSGFGALPPVVLQLLGFPLALAAFLVYGLVSELYLRRRLWALFAGSVSIANTHALNDILQQAQQREGGFGEAFDGGFEIAG